MLRELVAQPHCIYVYFSCKVAIKYVYTNSPENAKYIVVYRKDSRTISMSERSRCLRYSKIFTDTCELLQTFHLIVIVFFGTRGLMPILFNFLALWD